VLSPSTRERDEGDKLLLYARAGVPEYWIADHDATDLRGYSLRNGVYVPLPRDVSILRSVVLPGLEIDVPALFTDLS
jgi:Uma2 family endonuclease